MTLLNLGGRCLNIGGLVHSFSLQMLRDTTIFGSHLHSWEASVAEWLGRQI